MGIPELHLRAETIAALADGELPADPMRRAAKHLARCLQCRLAVQVQREVSEADHRSKELGLSGDLMSRLRAIDLIDNASRMNLSSEEVMAYLEFLAVHAHLRKAEGAASQAGHEEVAEVEEVEQNDSPRAAELQAQEVGDVQKLIDFLEEVSSHYEDHFRSMNTTGTNDAD